VSAPKVVLAAIAGRTKRIRLGSAVTVLSSDDPIRVFQRFSTLDAISSGRAEVILGRGSFTESFPLFGYELSQYEALFEEKLDLFASLIKQQTVTWHGPSRPPLTNQQIFPPIEKGTLKTWIGVGGSPESVLCSPIQLAADACHHWRRTVAFRAICRSLLPSLRTAYNAGAADRCSFARPYRGYR
jgi:alkanesulfonate monooxygenase SsuD/methylene tetrahydromethanopterin reductase-like flavin-dependent oxidoreductase (luciferase family)